MWCFDRVFSGLARLKQTGASGRHHASGHTHTYPLGPTTQLTTPTSCHPPSPFLVLRTYQGPQGYLIRSEMYT